MNVKKVIGFAVNYIAAIALSVIFALFLSGQTGWFFTIAFAAAPVVSILFTAVQSRFVSLASAISVSCVNKGEEIEMEITVTNSSFLPSPPIRIEAADTPGIRCLSQKLCTISVMPRTEQCFSFSFCADIWGKSQIGIKTMKVEDYFGLISVKSKQTYPLFTVYVIPEIAERENDDPIVRSAYDISVFSDDTDDTSEISSGCINGLPGYEHREYTPGDPLKRVNWKLSAKKHELLVRLDDEMPSPHISVVLDSVFSSDIVNIKKTAQKYDADLMPKDELLLRIAENAVEVSLGIVQSFLRLNRSVTYYMYSPEGWTGFAIDDESSLNELSLALAEFSFLPREELSFDELRIPTDMIIENKSGVSVVFCTPCCDDGIGAIVGIQSGDRAAKGELYFTVFSSSEA